MTVGAGLPLEPRSEALNSTIVLLAPLVSHRFGPSKARPAGSSMAFPEITTLGAGLDELESWLGVNSQSWFPSADTHRSPEPSKVMASGWPRAGRFNVTSGTGLADESSWVVVYSKIWWLPALATHRSPEPSKASAPGSFGPRGRALSVESGASVPLAGWANDVTVSSPASPTYKVGVVADAPARRRARAAQRAEAPEHAGQGQHPGTGTA